MLWQVFVMTTIMASASGLGAVPFFFTGSLSVEWAALANAIACGVMLAASFDLVHEGQPYGAAYTVLGVLMGAHVAHQAARTWLPTSAAVSLGIQSSSWLCRQLLRVV